MRGTLGVKFAGQARLDEPASPSSARRARQARHVSLNILAIQ